MLVKKFIREIGVKGLEKEKVAGKPKLLRFSNIQRIKNQSLNFINALVMSMTTGLRELLNYILGTKKECCPIRVHTKINRIR